MTSVADKYARSITSSHLEVSEFAGDIDSLIASGWVRESLATLLWRLRVEFDAVDARDIAPLPEMAPPDRLDGEETRLKEWRAAEKERIAKDFKDRTTMARALALVHLQSLSPAKEALGRFVMAMATRQSLALTPEEELRLSGRILNAFLDPLCKVCDGVRFKTVPGTGRLSAMPCDACSGSGRARIKYTGNPDAVEIQFTNDVLGELDRKIEFVAKVMKRFLREREVVL